VGNEYQNSIIKGKSIHIKV